VLLLLRNLDFSLGLHLFPLGKVITVEHWRRWQDLWAGGRGWGRKVVTRRSRFPLGNMGLVRRRDLCGLIGLLLSGRRHMTSRSEAQCSSANGVPLSRRCERSSWHELSNFRTPFNPVNLIYSWWFRKFSHHAQQPAAQNLLRKGNWFLMKTKKMVSTEEKLQKALTFSGYLIICHALVWTLIIYHTLHALW
jgi:hypothetical protein